MRSAPLFSILAVVTAVACHTAPRELKPVELTRARLLRIEDTRRDEGSYIDSLLASGGPRERADAALAAGRIGARAHIPLLRKAAEDPDSAVSANALFALGMLKDSGAVGQAARSLSRDRAPAREAAWLLGELGDAGRAALVTGLQNSALTAETHGALLLASTRLRPVPAAAIEPFLSNTDSALGWRAAYALSRGRAIASARRVYRYSASPYAAVREQVAAMASKAVAGDSLQSAAMAILGPMLRDTSAHVRTNAVRSVASYGTVNRELVLAALRDPDPNVALAASEVLGTVLDSNLTAWMSAFAVDTEFAVQRTIAEGAAAKRFALLDKTDWGRSADARRRAVYTELAFRVDRNVAPSVYEPWLADTARRVRLAVTRALAGLPDSIGNRTRRRATLKRLLADPEMDVRTAALSSLARGASADDFDAALASYRLSLADPDDDARVAFWRFSDSLIVRNKQLPANIEGAFASISKPLSRNEANAAGRIARFAAWRDTSVAARPTAFYEDRIRETLDRAPVLVFETQAGVMEVRTFATDAPLTVYNAVSLARRGYFDGQRWHRVVPNFVVQAGAPRDDGNGGPGYSIRDEINRRRYTRGSLGMALSGPNTGGSQFFITHSTQPHLDGGYTVFGEVISGFDVLDRIRKGDRIVRISVR